MKFFLYLITTIFLIFWKADNVNSGYSSSYYSSSGYCSNTYRSLCGYGENHVGCVTKGFSSKCAPGTVVMDMTSEVKAVLLNHHNQLRNKIAMGHVRGYPSASKMATMTWSDELANLAKLNVYQCDIEHDQCRATLAFNTPGQNLCTRSGPYEHLHGVIHRCVDAWFAEKSIARPSYVDYLVVEPHFKQYGHFTQMIVDRSFKMGCAMVRVPSSYYGRRYYLACNYSSSQEVGFPLYRRGRPGTTCYTGRNPHYPGLCSVREPFSTGRYRY